MAKFEWVDTSTNIFKKTKPEKMEEGPYDMPKPVPTLEQKLDGYKNIMELLRTVIGVIVLGIQLVILYKLLTK
jgi:hypothetical protein